MRYAKIFDSIWEGSMRGKSDPLFVFMNLLTHSDEHGIVDRHWRAIADETGLPQDRIVAALTFLESPDEESRTPNEDGRRIVRLDEHRSWGWRIVNHKYYRELCTKVQNAERQAKFRKNNSSVTDSNAVVTHHNILPVGVGVVVDASVSASELPLVLEEIEMQGKEKPRDLAIDFNEFWKAYPRKKAKGDAIKAWFQLSKSNVLPENSVMLPVIEAFKKSEDWTKEGGQYIPYPATWLRSQCWHDQLPESKKSAINNETSESLESYAKSQFGME